MAGLAGVGAGRSVLRTIAEIDPQENLRQFSLIPRRTPEWKALYAKRQSVERRFSRLEQHRALDSHFRRGCAR